MPPLPEPTYIYHWNPSTGEDDLFEFASSGAVDEGCKYCERLFTTAQLQSYAAPLVARVAELERQNEAQKDEWLSWEAKRVELERGAARYRMVRRGQHWSVIDGIGNTLRADELDKQVDAAIAAKD